MTTCPNCHKPVSGRLCGYCGTSLVENYFTQTARAKDQYPSIRTGNLVSAAFGVLGALVLLAAAGVQFLDYFGESPSLSLFWWIRLTFLGFCGTLFLAQQLILRGLRFSMFYDGSWLFVFVATLSFCSLLMIDRGIAGFTGNTLVALLMLCGCGICALSCIIGIIFYRKPG